MNAKQAWERFCQYRCVCPETGVSVDISRMAFPDGLFADMAPRLQQAFAAMEALEGGAIANPDEQRMVGHYWLRRAELAPTPAIQQAIFATVAKIKAFASGVHQGVIAPPLGKSFQNILLVGIGGSALGPQFVNEALRGRGDKMQAFFCDNTDPDGIDRVLGELSADLARTLTIVISKSGSTKETRNGMLEVARAYEAAGLPYARHFVAVTSDGSALHKQATDEHWLELFPMWDWVGGRTSQTSAVGLLPAALQGIDIDALLEGARQMDERTRRPIATDNPAALLALMWFDAARHRGFRDMVILPYKDRLALLSRYLQQLIMESLGKEQDLAGNTVHEGLTVYGNKGSTDQHAYVQQLREGLHNFFVTFVEVLRDREGASMEVEPGITSGDYLSGFLLGTREALTEKSRESITITLEAVTPQAIGAIIALFERAVGLYASLVNINAYHQPGVEAGKRAAGHVLALQNKLVAVMRASAGQSRTAGEWAEAADAGSQVEWVYKILRHLAANPDRGIVATGGPKPTEARFHFASEPQGASSPPGADRREGA